MKAISLIQSIFAVCIIVPHIFHASGEDADTTYSQRHCHLVWDPTLKNILEEQRHSIMGLMAATNTKDKQFNMDPSWRKQVQLLEEFQMASAKSENLQKLWDNRLQFLKGIHDGNSELLRDDSSDTSFILSLRELSHLNDIVKKYNEQLEDATRNKIACLERNAEPFGRNNKEYGVH